MGISTTHPIVSMFILTHTRSGLPMLKLTCACIIWEIVERLFRLYHLPLTSAEQNDCAPEEISVVGESPVEERAANCSANSLLSAIDPPSCLLLAMLSDRSEDRPLTSTLPRPQGLTGLTLRKHPFLLAG